MRKIAFFDFDNTLYGGYTYEDFVNFVSENILKTNEFQSKSDDIVRNTPDYNEMVLKLAKVVGEIITGWEKEKFDQYCKISCSKNKILDWAIPVMDFLDSVGFEKILVSASFDAMVADSLEVLKIEKAYCSLFEIIDGKYSGEIELLLNNDRKHEMIVNEINGEDTFSIAFGDSIGDAPMLDFVDLPFLVRSHNPEIEQIAKEKSWFLGSNPETIIEKIKEKIS